MPGMARLVDDNGQIALVGVGDAFHLAADVHKLLLEAGSQARLVDLRSVKPMDEILLRRLGDECSYVFSFETGSIIGGAGARIAQLLWDKTSKVINFGYPDSFVPHGKTELLKQRIGFTPEALAERIIQITQT